MLHTTFKLLRKHDACVSGYKKLAKALGGVGKFGRDKPIPLSAILDSNGLQDAIWSIRAVLPEEEADRDRVARLFACACVREVWHLLKDERSRKAVETAERYARGNATDDELDAAWDAARDAAWVAAWDAARDAARDAAWVAARAAARDAAWDAARDAAWAAARAAARDAAWDAAWEKQAAAWEAARDAAWEKQVILFRAALGEGGKKEAEMPGEEK